jgi:hypothetical protein
VLDAADSRIAWKESAINYLARSLLDSGHKWRGEAIQNLPTDLLLVVGGVVGRQYGIRDASTHRSRSAASSMRGSPPLALHVASVSRARQLASSVYGVAVLVPMCDVQIAHQLISIDWYVSQQKNKNTTLFAGRAAHTPWSTCSQLYGT